MPDQRRVRQAIGGDYKDGSRLVAEALIALGKPIELTVGTLNYDGLRCVAP